MPCNFPNFFFVGGPKCGTSAINNMLSQHPDIYMSPVKEPHYFCDDLFPPNYIRNYKNYIELFENVANEKVIGESSATYLYSKNAAKNIKTFSPDARILMVLRNPVDMIYSLYWQSRASGVEKEKTFEKALQKEEERKADPDKSRITFTLYKDAGLYYEQVQRYFEYFNKEQIYIVIYEDFKEQPMNTFTNILRFLQVNADFTPRLNMMNTSRLPRYDWLATLIKHMKPNKGQKSNVFRRKLVGILRKFNNQFTEKPPMNKETRLTLLSEYKDNNEKLQNLIGKDLSFWNF